MAEQKQQKTGGLLPHVILQDALSPITVLEASLVASCSSFNGFNLFYLKHIHTNTLICFKTQPRFLFVCRLN